MQELKKLYTAVVEGEAEKVKYLCGKILEEGVNAKDVLDECLIPAMQEVGDKFESGEYFVPNMLMSARAMKLGLEILQPAMSDSGMAFRGKLILGTVKGDLHDIGKNLVATMLEGSGYKVIDLGIDVDTERFINTAKIENADVLGMSALLTTTMNQMKYVIEGLEKEGIRENVKVIIGGAPITVEFCNTIGADGYCEEANGAVKLVERLLCG